MRQLGIEPRLADWKSAILPLNYWRAIGRVLLTLHSRYSYSLDRHRSSDRHRRKNETHIWLDRPHGSTPRDSQPDKGRAGILG